MSDAWRDATAMMSANREVLLVVAAIFFLLPSLVFAVTMPGLQEQMMAAKPEDAEAMMEGLLREWGATIIVAGIAVTLAQIVGYLGLLALLRDARRPTVGEALKAGLAGLLPAIGFYLIMCVAIFVIAMVIGIAGAVSAGLVALLILLFVVVAVYVMIKFSLVLAVIAIDKVSNPITAMSRSWALTKGNSFRLFGFFLLIVVVYMVVSIVVATVVGLLVAIAGSSVALMVNGIVSSILGTALTVVFVAVVAATHRQLSGISGPEVGETFD
jgi:hypothetical protein